MAAPLLVMLGGPNGAGKSTFHEVFLRDLGLPFLDADTLARETGIDAYEAAQTIARIRDGCIARRESFITETVLSDPVREKVEVLWRAAVSGYDVTLIYIGLKSSELSAERVRARVLAGGHDVPEEKLANRYLRSLDNLEWAIVRLPRVLVYDNSSFASPFRLLGEFRHGECVQRGEGDVPGWAQRFLG